METEDDYEHFLQPAHRDSFSSLLWNRNRLLSPNILGCKDTGNWTNFFCVYKNGRSFLFRIQLGPWVAFLMFGLLNTEPSLFFSMQVKEST